MLRGAIAGASILDAAKPAPWSLLMLVGTRNTIEIECIAVIIKVAAGAAELDDTSFVYVSICETFDANVKH